MEVKSSKNYPTVSYDAFKSKFGKKIGVSYVVHPKTLQIVEDDYRGSRPICSFVSFSLLCALLKEKGRSSCNVSGIL